MRTAATTSIALLALLLPGPSIAQEARREAHAHEHGAGRLAIAIEGNRVEIELESPGSDIVGFEHAPKKASERQDVAAARERLAKIEAVIRLPAEAGCRMTEANVTMLGGAANVGNAKGGHGGHDHGKATEKASNAPAGSEAAHSEFHATYALTCSAPERLGQVGLEYFKSFPKAQKLAVTIAGPKGQSATEVRRDKPVLDLAGRS